MNESTLSLNVRTAVGAEDLVGVAAGKAALPRLISAAAIPPNARWVALDFEGMQIVSASAARESILHLCAVIEKAGALPVLLNANQEILDELGFAAQALKQPLVAATATTKGLPVSFELLGSLDPKHMQTLRIVVDLGEADARTASEVSGDTSTGITAWNNRLATLANMRLLRERKEGKTKYYSLTLKGLVRGN